ncbi:hypothetical protein [Parafilimonas sp.]|uniref:hypothetical protein n=1 Tax=Parafilimonas sp. TaxID=1969739 RepID=UPI0039E2BAD7
MEKNAKAYDYNVGALDADTDLNENILVEIDDISQKDQATDIADDLSEQATRLDHTINTIKRYQTESQNEITPGALVETGLMYLLIGVALPSLQVNDKKV